MLHRYTNPWAKQRSHATLGLLVTVFGLSGLAGLVGLFLYNRPHTAAVPAQVAAAKAPAAVGMVGAICITVNDVAQMFIFLDGTGRYRTVDSDDCTASTSCLRTLERLLDAKKVDTLDFTVDAPASLPDTPTRNSPPARS